MEKAGIIVRDALAELQSSQPEQALKPVDFNTGVRYLNRMLDAWAAIGIDLGTSRVQLPDDYLDIPPSAMAGVIFNLAIELANRFGYPISNSLSIVAAKHYQSIVRLFSVKPSSYSGNLPRGSGNVLSSDAFAAFYPEDGAPILDTSGEIATSSIIQSATPPSNPAVGTLWLNTSNNSGTTGIIQSATPPANPVIGTLWLNTSVIL